jgi:hypothetical protein
MPKQKYQSGPRYQPYEFFANSIVWNGSGKDFADYAVPAKMFGARLKVWDDLDALNQSLSIDRQLQSRYADDLSGAISGSRRRELSQYGRRGESEKEEQRELEWRKQLPPPLPGTDEFITLSNPLDQRGEPKKVYKNITPSKVYSNPDFALLVREAYEEDKQNNLGTPLRYKYGKFTPDTIQQKDGEYALAEWRRYMDAGKFKRAEQLVAAAQAEGINLFLAQPTPRGLIRAITSDDANVELFQSPLKLGYTPVIPGKSYKRNLRDTASAEAKGVRQKLFKDELREKIDTSPGIQDVLIG